MRRKLLVLLAVVSLLAGMAFPPAGLSASADGKALATGSDAQYMPPSVEKIENALKARGAIKAGATEDEISRAVEDYIRLKLKKTPQGRAENPVLDKKAKAVVERAVKDVESEKLIRPGKGLGRQPLEVDPFTAQPWNGPVKKDKILVLLVEFGDPVNGPAAAPEHNYMEKPPANNNIDFWTSDFSRDYFQKMLFTPGGITTPEGIHLDSMTDYFLEQSGGSYTVDGQVFGWFKVDQPEKYYGDDNPNGGTDNLLPGTPKDLIKETLKLADAAGVPWNEYDQEDPYDLDGDGETNEPDGIIDHLMIVHAGDDQAGGGGAQGDDAIWSHSSSLWAKAGARNGRNIYAYNYTIMPENGALGVFAHEFTHDLGLPDEYDTIYSGNGEPVGFWSLMSSGSWTGKPLGTRPPSISPWGRMVLGLILGGQWVQPASVSFSSLTKAGTVFLLDQTTGVGQNEQALRINLPKKPMYVNTPFSGSWEWYGGKADEIDTRLVREVDLTGKTGATLSYAAWYEIEDLWDFGFVQVSADGGATWKSLATPRMTSQHDPDAMESIVANLPGYTGSSGGWVTESIDLSAYAGQKILLQFRYMTDWGTTYAGFMVDDIKVIAGGQTLFFDNVETADPAWTADGWTRFQGQELKSHYYLAEWRNLAGFDDTLKDVYNIYNVALGQANYFPYQPGMLLWYRDTSYTDNWVGVHPGRGFLGVVDSKSAPMLEPVGGSAWRTRIQIYDAPFSLWRADDITLTRYGKTKTYQGNNAAPEFDDGWSYWSPKAPSSGLKLTPYGVNIRVLGGSADNSVGAVGVYLDK